MRCERQKVHTFYTVSDGLGWRGCRCFMRCRACNIVILHVLDRELIQCTQSAPFVRWTRGQETHQFHVRWWPGLRCVWPSDTIRYGCIGPKGQQWRCGVSQFCPVNYLNSIQGFFGLEAKAINGMRSLRCSLSLFACNSLFLYYSFYSGEFAQAILPSTGLLATRGVAK